METLNFILYKINSFIFSTVYAAGSSDNPEVDTGFTIPSLADIIGFIIRLFFFLAGFMALIYLILGAISWITSSGDKEKVSKAQEKIQAAVIGLVVLVAVISLIALVEQVFFNGKFCLGLTCPINFDSFRLLN